MEGFFGLYQPGYLRTLVYMLQSTEYQIGPYIQWYWRTKNFNQIMQRRTLEPTKAARYLLLTLKVGVLVQIVLGLFLAYLGFTNHLVGGIPFGAALIIVCPVLWAHLIVVPLVLGRLLIAKPAERRLVDQSHKIFGEYKGVKIAVAGSYGKTTMKELLRTVLSEGLQVAATPANKNVAISHAYFAKKLSGTEDVLIIEYGEGAPGDVARFAQTTQPTHAVITGLSPAHLDQYKTLQAAGSDIFSVADYLKGQNVYVNDESTNVTPFLRKSYHLFDTREALSWKTQKINVGLEGTSFVLKKGDESLKLQSGLVGHHQVGYLAFVAAFALELGLNEKQVVAGIGKTKPFEHRMQPYQLSGAWIIDDTYNGNLEGIRAGTKLLAELKARRKIYVTPGLVDQGEETKSVHLEMGTLIAEALPDVVILMKNSVTAYLEQGLKDAHYKGDLRIESNPLEFYTNLSHFVASGDLVVMQNDWPDNYH